VNPELDPAPRFSVFSAPNFATLPLDLTLSGRPGRDEIAMQLALVSMMQTSYLRKFDDDAQLGRLNRPGLRRVFGQP
jgi:hypothetical protein